MTQTIGKVALAGGCVALLGALAWGLRGSAVTITEQMALNRVKLSQEDTNTYYNWTKEYRSPKEYLDASRTECESALKEMGENYFATSLTELLVSETQAPLESMARFVKCGGEVTPEIEKLVGLAQNRFKSTQQVRDELATLGSRLDALYGTLFAETAKLADLNRELNDVTQREKQAVAEKNECSLQIETLKASVEEQQTSLKSCEEQLAKQSTSIDEASQSPLAVSEKETDVLIVTDEASQSALADSEKETDALIAADEAPQTPVETTAQEAVQA